MKFFHFCLLRKLLIMQPLLQFSLIHFLVLGALICAQFTFAFLLAL